MVEAQTQPDPGVSAHRRPEHSFSTAAWTIPLVCIGIAIIACCMLIPGADENRRLAYDKLKLEADLTQLQAQVETNGEFLKRVGDDPTLAERLAQRQMKMVREGSSVLELKEPAPGSNLSPFLLTAVPPPPTLPEYRPSGGRLAAMCRQPRTRLYLMGAALLAIAAGLVLENEQRQFQG
jgi:hypothetical protein